MVTTRLAEKILSDVSPTRRFVVHNGSEIKNLRELADAVRLMPNSTFHYHVSGQRNDFAEWVKEHVGDWQLADDMERAGTRKEMAGKVRCRQEYLSRAVGEQSIAHEHFMFAGVKEFIVGISVGIVIGMIVSIVA